MTDPWRYRCPKGHCSWKSRQSGTNNSKGRYYCPRCKENGEKAYYDQLVDAKHDELCNPV